jgi:hypothetical protein
LHQSYNQIIRRDGARRSSADTIEPEDSSLWVYGVGEDGVPAFTRDGINNLRQIIANERAVGKGPPPKPPK